jgi:hypothetical protein
LAGTVLSTAKWYDKGDCFEKAKAATVRTKITAKKQYFKHLIADSLSVHSLFK